MSEPYTVLVDAPGELLATAQREKGPGWAAQYGPLLLLTLKHLRQQTPTKPNKYYLDFWMGLRQTNPENFRQIPKNPPNI